MKSYLKYLIVFSLIAISASSCKKNCYTCQAENFGYRVDFDESCGSETEKQQMEADFRKQYPDSVYFVHCD